jgi:hypothetical protein
MGVACRSCNGMGRLKNGTDCPVCVGGQPDPFPPIEVTPKFIPPVRNVEDLPPSTATPDGRIAAGMVRAPDEPEQED